MGGRAKPEAKKAQIQREVKERLMLQAVEAYKLELEKPAEDRKGARTICKEISAQHCKQTGQIIPLDHNTMLRRTRGGKSKAQSNAEKGWLMPEEVETIIRYGEELSERAIPLTLRTLEECVNFVLRARLGPSFPGVGHNWTSRFMLKHSDRLKMFNSSSLESARARAANPANHAKFFDIVEELFAKHDIQPDCIYGMDETGFMPGRGCVSKVIGKSENRNQHTTESGNRNNITVLPVICADGTSIPPLVIFSGQAYSVSWLQNNPLKASIGYQKKGYIDDELGIDWIKHVDKHTKAKANGRDRALFVDSHRSRLTFGLLNYCRQQRIHVICYPSHATQLYQGLDVVIFALLKRNFSKEMRKFEQSTGQAVSKENFLTVYTPAHLESFTEANIKAAFAKTGVYPVDRNAIPKTALKTSIETSSSGDGLPLPQPSPVKAMANLIKQTIAMPLGNIANGAPMFRFPSVNTPSASTTEAPSIPIDPVLLEESRTTVNDLRKTSAGFLLSRSPIKSSSNIPCHIPKFPLPLPIPEKLLSLVPDNRFEEELQDLLENYVKREALYVSALTSMQASLILQCLYCERLRGQLHAKESKGEKKKGSGKLIGDGLPRCLTADEFVERVEAFVERQLAEAAEKERMNAQREAYAIAMEEWNKSEAARKAAKETRRAQWVIEVEDWEKERVLAKKERRRPRWKKPILGELPKAAPKPKVPRRAVVTEDEEINIDDVDDAETSSNLSDDDV